MNIFYRVIFSICLLSISVITQANVIRFGVGRTFPPFIETDQFGNVDGFDIAVAENICNELRVRCEFIHIRWLHIIPALDKHKIDAIIDALTITPQRRRFVSFSEPYYSAPSGIIMPDNRTFEFTTQGLAGKTIGVTNNTSYETYFSVMFPRRVNLKTFVNIHTALHALDRNQLDAVVSDLAPLQFWLENNRHLSQTYTIKQSPPSIRFLYNKYGIAVQRNNTTLLKNLNKAIQRMRSNGILSLIEAHYLPKNRE